MNPEAIKELLFKMADDELIMGHRHSEWTGLGPMLEEDIAFSSMAQDKIGHALALYSILHEQFGEATPDELAFRRKEKNFKCCHLVELPNGEYDFSLIRHFLFDHAEMLRYEMLQHSSFEPLAHLAKKIKGELKYHVLHADSWIKRLGGNNEESHGRMQTALNECDPLAMAIFEEGPFEKILAEEKIFEGENSLKKRWLENIERIVFAARLQMPAEKKDSSAFGGRYGFHTSYLADLLNEMDEVIRLEENAEW